MTALYGWRWNAEHDDESRLKAKIRIWARLVASLTPEQIRAALIDLERDPSENPPNPAQFRAMCPPKPFEPTVKPGKASPEVAEAAFAQMRRALGIRR